jgi:phenylacetate-coenzyme A ligase PaaK-like adenylate-forming protein
VAQLREHHKLRGKKAQASYLNIYPSYLGQLVEYGLAAGYGPSDFGVERISVGGELVTAGLKARTQALFGPVRFSEGYGMTETWPTAALRCSQGHLHFESSQALVEVIDPATCAAARPGDVGSLVVTPLPPYRETTILLRYDTEDLVRVLDAPVTCELRHQPATSNLLGKRRLAVRHEAGWTYPREVLEALESVEAVPLPARCGFWAKAQGVVIEVVTRDTSGAVRSVIQQALEEQGVPLTELHLVLHPCQLQHPRPLRGDLREHSFGVAT